MDYLLAPLSRAVGEPCERNSQVGRGSFRKGKRASILSEQALANITLEESNHVLPMSILIPCCSMSDPEPPEMMLHDQARTSPATVDIHHHQARDGVHSLPLDITYSTQH